ncbi:MAG: sulfatase-like hydrolase/transferase [Myxococcota bacterium]
MNVLLEIGAIALVAVLVARFARPPWRNRTLNLLKVVVTFEAFRLLLTHPVTMEDGSKVVAWRLVVDTVGGIELSTFLVFCAAAAGIKFIGILASMYRWQVLLRGQAIELPFRHIFGSFLIGRFIGTFLPSTAGLDGYKLYDAARFSGRTVEVTATTALEKVIGVTGIFSSFLIALPFGFSLFGDNAALIAGVTVPLCTGLIGALMLVLWFPGIIQWFLEHLPIPGKARLEGLVMRVSHSAAAYRGRKRLVLLAFALSFVVHFTTATMYWFTALAIGATQAEFWPTVLGSSVQILATVLSPFTIAGEGIREAAQYFLLGNVIGPANAIVSAALGFWAAEALTMLGAYFWWFRPRNYHPAFCRVNGVQVDYAEAAKAAVTLETDEERERRSERALSAPPPLWQRVRLGAALGLASGLCGGLLIGAAESLVIALGGLGGDAQVLWYGPLAYAALLGGLGCAGGAALAVLPVDREEIRGWTPSLVLLGTLLPFSLAISLFRIRRDVFLEQMPPLPVLAALLGAAAAVALLLFLLGPRLFRTRLGDLVRPLPALAALGVVVAGGAVAGRVLMGSGADRQAPPPVPAELRERPNVILVMVDTLRADHLSCYGAQDVNTPALCSLAGDGGAIFDAYAHASWTKPSAATLLSSLLPSTHGAISKPAALSEQVEMLAEPMQRRGYATGGIVSNINLAPSFGFDQGYDEYHYLAPDYLAGAKESSSKLILYSIARAVWFKRKGGLRVGDFYQDSATVNGVAFDFLERHRDARFFLFLHYMDPHDPYFVHPYDGQAIARVSNQHPDAALAAEMRRLYVGEIEYLDANFAALLEKLRELDLYDDTLIALVADHGEEFQEHDGWWHGLTLYDEQIRVPLLIKWGGRERSVVGDAGDRVVGLIDVAPTLLARAGAEIPPAMQGVDLAAEPPPGDRMVFAEEDHEGNVLRAVRTREWKLIEVMEQPSPRGLKAQELYHVAEDPGESRNLRAEREEIASELRAHAEAQEKLARSQATGAGEARQLTAAEEEALRALGYID